MISSRTFIVDKKADENLDSGTVSMGTNALEQKRRKLDLDPDSKLCWSNNSALKFRKTLGGGNKGLNFAQINTVSDSSKKN